jgi:4-alpha-glucanotransferase
MKFTHAERRLSGIVVPLSAIRSEASPGCGEFADLERIGDLAAAWGYDLVQLLPVNDSGFQSSPYFALSAFALNPIYIRIADLAEIAADGSEKLGDGPVPAAMAAEFRAQAEALVRRYAGYDRVPYASLLKEKLALLRKVWDAASASSGGASRSLLTELETWIEANPWIRGYAAFVALKAQDGERPWWEWSRYQDPTDSDIAALWRDRALVEELRFWAWLQMRAAGQFLSAAKYLAEKGIALMGDIPILMNKDSADVWAKRRFFRLELAAGAPPDMYASMGQNWGFPIYDWEALEREGYSFWNERLVEADKYYSCYRIDHVLGFFRIWALSDREITGAQGHFVPEVPIRLDELASMGFPPERIRWMSLPHIPLWRLVQSSGESAARGAIFAALDRIGEENLYLFKPSIHGEKDIEALPSISPAARDCLLAAWRDRALFEYGEGQFTRTWSYGTSSCWPTLSDRERASLESLFRKKAVESEALWTTTGARLLGALSGAVPMLACAEDLGSVPDCVPAVLADLGILGLRVMRWARRWADEGQPYVPVAAYPELSVACPSVHDSSSLREWWENEADRGRTWGFASASLERDLGPCPDHLGAEQVEILLELIARSNSRFAAYPIQELLAMSDELRPVDPKSERINVPGTVGADNWSYRMPWSVDALLADKKLTARARSLAKARKVSKKAGGASRKKA